MNARNMMLVQEGDILIDGDRYFALLADEFPEDTDYLQAEDTFPSKHGFKAIRPALSDTSYPHGLYILRFGNLENAMAFKLRFA